MTMRWTQNNWLPLALIVGGLPIESAMAQWDWSGSIGAEIRTFLNSGRFPGQNEEFQASLLVEPEVRWRSDSGNHSVSVIPYARLDSVDDQRTHLDLREAYWAYEGNDWDVLVGVNKVFWGVTESRHLVDVINQTDFVEDPDEEDKLGQPMVNLNIQRDWGRISAFLLPYFRQRSFPGRDGRLRGPFPVDEDRPIFTEDASENELDFAFRYSHYFGNVDVGLYWFHGNNREPRLQLDLENEVFRPVYDEIDQYGIDLQYTGDAWLWKLEAIVRDAPLDTFFAFVGGFEYTLYQINDGETDLGFLLEYQYDGRAASEAPTLADDDIFAGVRWSLNDVQDTSVLFGMAYDVNNANSFINLEAERRLGDSLKAELRLRMFAGASADEFAFATERDDYVQFRLTQFF